jgi:hypothetical protein
MLVLKQKLLSSAQLKAAGSEGVLVSGIQDKKCSIVSDCY